MIKHRDKPLADIATEDILAALRFFNDCQERNYGDRLIRDTCYRLHTEYHRRIHGPSQIQTYEGAAYAVRGWDHAVEVAAQQGLHGYLTRAGAVIGYVSPDGYSKR